MAPKPQRFRHSAETKMLGPTAKKPGTLNTNAASSEADSEPNPMKDAFGKYAIYLNDLNDKRERVVKASRDITMKSKKVIFQVHRRKKMEKEGEGGVGNFWHVMFIRSWLSAVALIVLTMHAIFNIIPNAFSEFVTTRLKERRVDHYFPLSNNRISKHNRDEVLGKADKDLAAVLDQYMSHLVKELQGTDFWKLRQAYSPGVQEYVEAATLCNFCKTGGLLNLDEINASLQPLSDPSLEPLQINVLDYLLGLADLTGELMRLAIGRISDGELEFAQKICNFVREIHREMMLIAPKMDDSSDIKTKMDTMLQSVMKIENACFGVHVRGSEYIPVLGSGETTCPSFGLPEVE